MKRAICIALKHSSSMQVLSRRGTTSSLGCNSELGFAVSLVKALVRNLKGVDTVPITASTT